MYVYHSVERSGHGDRRSLFDKKNKTKPLNAVLAEDNGIEPSSLSQWDGFQDRLGAMPSILRSL